ncbi:MAG TPA: cation diffusion facilitator family transporter [Candidatus Dormibacteraeota bacterium]|jgi:cation diffusion facilitator family transporter
MTQPRHDEEGHRREANRAVGVSAVGLALTGGLELVLAVFTGSVALLGDALHNLSDVSTSAVVFLGFRISKRGPTAAYPYGYERAEDLAGLGVALVIWLSAAFAGFESYLKFVRNGPTDHLAIGMAGAVLGIIGNQAVARYKAHVGRRIQSATLEADAKHSWLDALSSLGALVGLAIVATGRRWGDPIAGFAVTLFIIHVGYTVTREILHHLMDGVDPAEMEAARAAAAGVDGISQVAVRGRWMGRSLVIEVEAALSAETTLADAEAAGRRVETAILGAVPAVRRVDWIPRPAGVSRA